MNLVTTSALIVGLVIWLAIGFLCVAHELLSRLIGETPSRSIQARSEPSNPEYEQSATDQLMHRSNRETSHLLF